MRTRSACVRPHVPMLYVSTGITNDAYSRRRSCRLMCARLNHTVYSLRNATLASCLRLATSPASPSSDPSLRVIRHSSSIRSACLLILVRSIFEPFMVSDHSARHGGAMRSMSSRNDRDVLMKSVSSTYSTSSGKAASSGGRGRVGRLIIIILLAGMTVVSCGWLHHRGKAQMACNYSFPTRTLHVLNKIPNLEGKACSDEKTVPVAWSDEKLIVLYFPGRGSNSRPSAHRIFKHSQGVTRP